MTDAERRRAFAAAFIEQARSDWRVYELLSDQSNTDACHRYHYLQMACEKLAKAYRLRDTSAAVDDLVKSHVEAGQITAPCKYTYPGLDLLRLPGGRAFLKLVKSALDDFEVPRSLIG